MSYANTPRTWTTGELVTAAYMNGLRDALNECAPAILTTAGDLLVASGASSRTRLAASATSGAPIVSNGSTPVYSTQWTLTSAAATGPAVALGTNPAATGTVRIANDGTIVWRNAANSGDASGLKVGSDDLLQVLNPTLRPAVDALHALGTTAARWNNLFLAGRIEIGTNPAASGTVRFANASTLVWRNTANSSDHTVLALINGDRIQLGTPGGTGIPIDFQLGGVATAQVTGSALQPGGDNLYSCGANGTRWTAVWAVNGTIQTSSRDAKNVEARVEPVDALAAVMRTPIYAYTYKSDDGDPLKAYRHVGFIAEEADRLICHDGATASPNTTASVALAAIQALAGELFALKIAMGVA